MSANQGKKLNTYTEVSTLENGSNIIINQLINGVLKVRQLTKAGFLAIVNALIVSSRVESITKANLLIKVNASTLEVGKKYLIADATAANFNLIVQAIAVNQIHTEAKDPLYPYDVVYYNFASDTITWRWDTVNDISAGEDWRNSNNISIGIEGCSNIEIGTNPNDITIGNNSTNIVIGNNCTTLVITENSSNIAIENYVQNLANTSDLPFFDDVSVRKDVRQSADGGNLVSYVANSGWVITPIV